MRCLENIARLILAPKLFWCLLFVILPFIGFPLASQAETNIKGIISSNQTWTLQGSPYIIQSHVLVPQGVSLTIEPGVEVRFENRFIIEVGGELRAIGNSNQRIVFTSNKAKPRPGDWLGIYFSPNSVDAVLDENGEYLSGSVISYAHFTYGNGANIKAYKSSPLISHNVFEKAKATSHDPSVAYSRGLGVISLCDSHSQVKSNLIRDNETIALGFYGGAPNISDNLILRNGYTTSVFGSDDPACYFTPAPGPAEASNGTILSGNLISANFGLGAINIENMLGSLSLERNCVINNNLYTLFRWPSPESISPEGYVVTPTKGAALMLPKDLAGISVRYNHFVDNANKLDLGALGFSGAQYGDGGAASFDFSLNNIVNPKSALAVHLATDFDWRDFEGNAPVILLANNFWGTSDPDSLNSRIQDHDQIYKLGDVIIEPMLEEAVPAPSSCGLSEEGFGVGGPAIVSKLKVVGKNIESRGGRINLRVRVMDGDLIGVSVEVIPLDAHRSASKGGRTQAALKATTLPLVCKGKTCRGVVAFPGNTSARTKRYKLMLQVKSGSRSLSSLPAGVVKVKARR